MPNRRTLIVSAAAAGLAACATPEARTMAAARRPIVIAHRGASGERPEHTLMAYRLGVEQGADFIEPDLVVTKDGHLVARHENEIGGTTDVASKPEFADRRREQVIDGERFEGWFVEDFTLAELKTLRARERLPQLRPGNVAFDGREAIPTFEEVIALAKAESARTGRVIGVYPETKHPTHHERLGLSFDGPLVAALKAAGWDAPDAPVFVQSFEAGNLERLARLTRAPLVQLLAESGGPADRPGATYAEMATPEGLTRLARHVAGIGPQKTMILARDAAGRSTGPTRLAADARAAGLLVHPWTFRLENLFLPAELRRGDPASPRFQAEPGDFAAEVDAFLAAGVDGLFADHVAIAAQARDRFVAAR